jgi:hypothetical protein
MTPRPSSKRRLTARERLLEHCARRRPPKWAKWALLMCRRHDAKTRRLLAAVLREYSALSDGLTNIKYAAAMRHVGISPELAQRACKVARAAVLRSGRGKR